MRDIDFNYILIRNGADVGKIWPAQDTSPTIRMNEDGEIKSSLSGRFLPVVYDFQDNPMEDIEIDWLADQIRAELVIDGTAYPAGVFLPSTVSTLEDVDGTGFTALNVEAYDRCWQVKDYTTTESKYFEKDIGYIDAIRQLLTETGITLVSAIESSATLSEEREDWDLGTSYLTIINQLLSEINYKPLWFNGSGIAILEPAFTPTAVDVTHTIDATDPDTHVRPGITRQTDVYQSPNVFLCICSNADKEEPLVAVAENTNPQSPLSIQRRGRRIMKVEYVDNIADLDELQTYANRLVNESLTTGETIVVTTGLLPNFGVEDTVALRYGELFTICVERGWTMELRTGGKMTHTLEKVVINLG